MLYGRKVCTHRRLERRLVLKLQLRWLLQFSRCLGCSLVLKLQWVWLLWLVGGLKQRMFLVWAEAPAYGQDFVLEIVFVETAKPEKIPCKLTTCVDISPDKFKQRRGGGELYHEKAFKNAPVTTVTTSLPSYSIPSTLNFKLRLTTL